MTDLQKLFSSRCLAGKQRIFFNRSHQRVFIVFSSLCNIRSEKNCSANCFYININIVYSLCKFTTVKYPPPLSSLPYFDVDKKISALKGKNNDSFLHFTQKLAFEKKTRCKKSILFFAWFCYR